MLLRATEIAKMHKEWGCFNLKDLMGILVGVFGVLFMISLIVAAIFSALATPKKNQPMEEKHKAAKKKANITILIGLGCVVLGIISLFLNIHLVRNSRKEHVDSQLFSGDFNPSELSSSFNNSTVSKPEEPPTASESEIISSNQNIVLYNQNNILIEYKSWKVDKTGNIEVNLYIENNAENDFYVRTENFSAEDFQMVINGTWQINAGKKLNDSITIYKSEIEKNGLSEVKNIEFDFVISSTDYTIKYVTDTISLVLE